MTDNPTPKRTFFSFPISMTEEQYERLSRMAKANERSVSAQARSIILPALEQWERETQPQAQA